METMLFMGALGAIVAVLFKSVFCAPKAPAAPAPQPKTKPATKAKVAKKKATAKAKPKAKPTAKKAAVSTKSTVKKAKPVAKKTAASAKSTTGSHQLKNPATGEVVTIPGSYRFVKRWIKDALVEEGLLDKVYKNSELTDAVNKKIKTAISKIKAIKKYQP
jgi:outer membrane biosynthesis protein TonB